MTVRTIASVRLPDEGVRVGHDRPLRLLSYNIQVGITTRAYPQYFLHSWKHLLPHGERQENLGRIGRMLSDFDLVGLQEVDAGSLRSGFINQTEQLGVQGNFPYWYDQINRNLGKIAQQSIGLLSRFRPQRITEHKLPGLIPGRGVLSVEFGSGEENLVLLILHMALSRRIRMKQVDFLAELASDYRHLIVMGDMNCRSESPEMKQLQRRTHLREPTHGMHTYPSWRPRQNIDHIFVSDSLRVEGIDVLDFPYSDHLPIMMEVWLPPDIVLTP